MIKSPRMKHCSKCEETKSLKEFSKNKRSKDGHNAWCKPCMRAYDKVRFATMGRDERDKRNAQRRQRSDQHILNILDYLEDKECLDCHATDPVILEFDHRENKDFNVADMVGTHKWSRILKEIKKCDVRCASCHRKKTANELGYRRLLFNGR